MLTFNNIPFSHSALLKFTIVGIVLLLILKVLKRLLLALLQHNKNKLMVRRYYPIFEIIMYMLFFTYTIDSLSSSNPVYAMGIFVVLLCLILWLSWYYTKTYFMGMLFKLNRKFNINDSIRFKTFEGKIIDMSARRMVIENDKGEQIFIPYDQLAQDTIIKHHPAQHILSYNFLLRTPATEKDIENRIKTIRSSLLSLPWLSLKKAPIVNIIDEEEHFQVYDITVYCPEKDYFYRVEKSIKQSYLHEDK